MKASHQCPADGLLNSKDSSFVSLHPDSFSRNAAFFIYRKLRFVLLIFMSERIPKAALYFFLVGIRENDRPKYN